MAQAIDELLGEVTKAVTASTEQTTASQELAQYVSGKMGEIDQRMDVSISELNEFMTQSELQSPIFRQSKNQFCNLTGNTLDAFSKNPHFTIDVSLYRIIENDLLWENRDIESQEILTSMGMHGVRYFQPQIRVMAMKWSGYRAEIHDNYTMYPNPETNHSGFTTIASYAKLIHGSISGFWLNGINRDWGICGIFNEGEAGRYFNAHPHVDSPSGEVRFIWPAIVSGKVTIDRNNPRWGYWPSIFSGKPFDITPGS